MLVVITIRDFSYLVLCNKLKVLLISPSGNTYTGNQLPGENDRFEEGKISQFTKIRTPESGTWNLDIQWDIPPTAPERVNLLLSEHTDVYTGILVFSLEYSPGQKVIINARLLNWMAAITKKRSKIQGNGPKYKFLVRK